MHERGILWVMISVGVWVIKYNVVWHVNPEKTHKKRGLSQFPTPIFETFSPDSKCSLLQNKKNLFLGKFLPKEILINRPYFSP